MRRPDDIGFRVQREAAAVVLLREQLAALGQHEPEYLDISIESETGFREMVEELISQEADTAEFISAIKTRRDDLKARQERFAKRQETLRTLIAGALEAAGLPKQETAAGTASVSRAAPTAIVTDEAAIPTRFWKASDPKLDRSALTQALRAREKAHAAAMDIAADEARAAALAAAEAEFPDIPGASLSNGGAFLTIRRS